MANLRSTSPRRRTQRRRTVSAAQSVRVYTAEPRRIRATRRAYFRLYMPRFTLNPWRNERDWRESRPKFLAAVLVVVLALCLYQMFTNPIFFVDALTVKGNRFVTPGELNDLSALRGWNVFFVDTHEVENTLRRMPELKEVSVSVGLPNLVQAQVVERMPRFVWESGGKLSWVDDDGIALRVRANVSGLLYLKDLDNSPVRVGERVSAEPFNAAVSLRNVWKNGPRAFEWSREHGLAVRDDHGWTVYFGSANQMAEKVTALQIVTAQILKEQKAVAFIDLGNGLPYYREAAPKKSGS